jgi:hypothetical protein
VSFLFAFAVARIFTSLFPTVSLTGSGIHVHHFWYGLIMLVIGGWLGISYADERVDRVAAILFGAGGGLIGDEVGLLLTFEDYWSGITFSFVIGFVSVASILILLNRYWKTLWEDFNSFTKRNISLLFGVFLAAISIAFITETDDLAITVASGVGTIVACIIILAYFLQRIIH